MEWQHKVNKLTSEQLRLILKTVELYHSISGKLMLRKLVIDGLNGLNGEVTKTAIIALLKKGVSNIEIKCPRYCRLCCRVIPPDEWESHRADHYKEIGDKYACRWGCGKRFFNSCKRNRHEKALHINAKEHKCDYCSGRFNVKRELRIHMDAVHRGIQHECKICKKKFSSRPNLAKHLTTHRDKQYKCTKCDNRFTKIGDFRSHALTHVESIVVNK